MVNYLACVLVAILAAFAWLPGYFKARDDAVNLNWPTPPVPPYGKIMTVRHSAETIGRVERESHPDKAGTRFAAQADLYYEAQLEDCDKGKNYAIMSGTNAPTWFYDELVDKLRAARFCTLVFDPRAHGRSEITPGGMSSELFAEDASALIRHVFGAEGRVHVGGIGLGGIVAYQLAIYHPEQVQSLFITACTACWARVPSDSLGCRDELNFAKRFFSTEMVMRSLGSKATVSAIFSALKVRNPIEVVDMWSGSLRMDRQVITPTVWLSIQGEKIWNALSNIKVPVLHVMSENEHLATGADEHTLTLETKKLPMAEPFVLLPGHSHFLIQEEGGLEKVWFHMEKFYRKHVSTNSTK